MKTYTVSEAIVFLNKLIPNIAPKSEETLRRAIRNGQLKAQVNLGREGSKILEEDLIAYSEMYKNRVSYNKQAQSKICGQENAVNLDMFSNINNNIGSSIVDVLRRYISDENEKNIDMFKLDLYEKKKYWENKRKSLLKQKQDLESEIESCESEIAAFEKEISSL